MEGLSSLLDVLVVGGGPSGNNAALKLSKLGYSVTVLDWRQGLGDKLCTGIIGRECADLYPPDERDVIHRARSATVVAPSGKVYTVVKDEPQAYVIDRVSYVKSIADRAARAGARYELGGRVTEIRRDSAGVKVRTGGRDVGKWWQAKATVIASGFSSPLLSMVGLGGASRTPFMLGCQAVVEARELSGTEVYLGQRIAPGAFGWLVPFSHSKALIGIVSRQKLNGHMRGFVSALQDIGKVGSVVKEEQRWGIPLKPIQRTYADRALAVGDAAGLVKPTTGGGIYYSLLSGEMAAQSLHEGFRTGDLSARSLSSYETRWKSVLGREMRLGYCARMVYESLGDSQIERLLNTLLGVEMQKEFLSAAEFSFDWHGTIIQKAACHPQVGKVIASFGPLVAPFLVRMAGIRLS